MGRKHALEGRLANFTGQVMLGRHLLIACVAHVFRGDRPQVTHAENRRELGEQALEGRTAERREGAVPQARSTLRRLTSTSKYTARAALRA